MTRKKSGVGRPCQHEYLFPKSDGKSYAEGKFLLDTTSEERSKRTKRHRRVRIKTEFGTMSLSEASERFGFEPHRFYALQKKHPLCSKSELLTKLIKDHL